MKIIERKKEGKLLKPYPVVGCTMLVFHAASSILYFGAIMLGKSILN